MPLSGQWCCRVVSHITEGVWASVYEVREEETGAPFALKVIPIKAQGRGAISHPQPPCEMLFAQEFILLPVPWANHNAVWFLFLSGCHWSESSTAHRLLADIITCFTHFNHWYNHRFLLAAVPPGWIFFERTTQFSKGCGVAYVSYGWCASPRLSFAAPTTVLPAAQMWRVPTPR